MKRVDCKMRQHHDKHGRVSLAKKVGIERRKKGSTHEHVCRLLRFNFVSSIRFPRKNKRDSWSVNIRDRKFSEKPQSNECARLYLACLNKTKNRKERKESNDYNSANMGVVLDVIRRGSHPIISILSFWDLVFRPSPKVCTDNITAPVDSWMEHR